MAYDALINCRFWPARRVYKGDAPSAPPPVDPKVQIGAEAAANRYDVATPFGTRTWERTGANKPLTYEEWIQTTYPGGVPEQSGGGQGAFNFETGVYDTVPIVGGADTGGQYGSYLEEFQKAAPLDEWKMTEALTPEMQRQLDARNRVSEAMLGKAEQRVSQIPTDQFKLRDEDIRGYFDKIAKEQYQTSADMLRPEFERQTNTWQQKMANMGLPMGDEAFNTELRGLTEGQDRTLSSLASQAALTGANLGMQRRGQSVNEQLTERQQMLNEIAQLMGGQQLQGLQVGQPAGLDVGGAFAANQAGRNQQYAGQLAGYNAGVASDNATMGAIATIAAMIMMCDRRLKHIIARVGDLMRGVPLYLFCYTFGNRANLYIGPIADEVAQVVPDAVCTGKDGYQRVLLGILFAAAEAEHARTA